MADNDHKSSSYLIGVIVVIAIAWFCWPAITTAVDTFAAIIGGLFAGVILIMVWIAIFFGIVWIIGQMNKKT